LTYKLDRGAEYEADELGVTLAAKAGYSVSGMIDVLQKLRARAGDPSMSLLYETHPHPNDRLAHIGEFLEAQLAKLPPGEEPPQPLEVAASSLPPPVAGRKPAPGNARALAAEPQATSAGTPPAGGATPSLPVDPGSLLRGLFGR